MIAKTPSPPYYAVIFTSIRTGAEEGYQAMASWMEKLAAQQEGFLGMESSRNEVGITVSYWRDEISIKKWKENLEHQSAQEKGKSLWYREYRIRVAKVERDYGKRKEE